MDIFDAITGRRSIRKYKDKKVNQEKIGMLLEAFRWAPSAGNKQPWEVIIVDNPEKIERLASAALDQMWMKTAPLVMAICLNERMAKGTYGQRSHQYAIQTIGMAIENMMLAAHSLELGSCCVTAFEEQEVKKILGCLEFVKPVSLITVGYPMEEPPVPHREDISHFTYYNSYREQYVPMECKRPGKGNLRKKIYEALREL